MVHHGDPATNMAEMFNSIVDVEWRKDTKPDEDHFRVRGQITWHHLDNVFYPSIFQYNDNCLKKNIHASKKNIFSLKNILSVEMWF